MNKLGCHVSFSKKSNYIIGAIETGIQFGCNTIMIFMGPPHTSKRVDINLYNKDLYFQSNLKEKIKPIDIIAHGPYIINPANPDKKDFAKSFLVAEMKRLAYIGGEKFVLHPGSNPNTKLGIETCAEVIKYALQKVTNVSIAIETMAGKGNEIGINFQQIKEIIDLVDNPRVGVCLDTCHV
jgi:deoxyribonuclease-4